MKAVSLWEPWATLVVTGEKKIETRSWKTDHRGPIAIHAAKEMRRLSRTLATEEPFRSTLAHHDIRPWEHDRPEDAFVGRGCIIGVVAIVDMVATGSLQEFDLMDSVHFSAEGKRREYAFGDYEPDRWLWRIGDDPVRLPVPIPCRGFQQIWNLDPDVERQLAEQLTKGST